jgi:ppGpp synthetase/RelA/SpoT-type nucleotidyltranferase
MFDRIIERVLAQLELQVRDLATCRWESLETLMNKKEITDTDQAALKRFYEEAVLHI